MKNLMKKGLIYIFALLLLFSMTLPSTATVKAAAPPLQLKAPSAILVNAETGKILYAKNADVKRSPASMTKMMAEYLILDAIEKGKISWDTPVNINDVEYRMSHNPAFSGIPLSKSVTYKVKELYKAMAIESANAATMALARTVAGSYKNFVKMMRQKAKKLGMKKVKFVNSTGLNNSAYNGHQPFGGPHEENMMSARATAKLAYHLLKDHGETLLHYTSIEKEYFKKGMAEPFLMENWNWMLPGLIYGHKGNGVDGLKTGHTAKAGYCFTGTVKRNGVRLISVVMKTDSIEARFQQTKILYDYGYNNFHKETLLDASFQLTEKTKLPVVKGKKETVALKATGTIKKLIENGTKDNYTFKLTIDQSKLNDKGQLVAPVKKGEKVGQVTLHYTGKNNQYIAYGYLTNQQPSFTIPVVTAQAVDKSSWFTLTMHSIGNFFAGIWSGVTGWITGLFS